MLRRIFPVIVFSFLAALALEAEPTIRRFPHEVSDLGADSAVRWGRLDNGLRYAIRHNTEPKGRVSLRFAVMAGSLEEIEEQRGLAHFLEHLAFDGSTHFAPGTLVEYFQRLGMGFGGDTNAFTNFDRTEFQLELPDTKPETLEKGFTLFADYADGLLLKPESIEKERGIILSEQRARDSVDLREWQDELEFLLPQGRLPKRLPIGLTDIIEHAQREKFADFYDTWYRPENIIVVVVGDIDPAAVEPLLRRMLAPVHAHGSIRAKPAFDAVPLPATLTVRLHTDPDAPSVHLNIETMVPYREEPDGASVRLRRVPRDLAVAMLNRRLAIRAKEAGSPFSAGEATIAEQFHFFRSADIMLTCQPAQWREALAVAEQELRRALDYGFQPAELHEAIAGLKNALEQAVQTATSQRSPDLANELIESVIDAKVFTDPAENQALFEPVLARVTVDDCLRAFREAWQAAPSRYVYLSGNLTLAVPEQEIKAAYAASQVVAVAPSEKIVETKFTYTDFGPLGQVASRQDLSNPDATLIEFKNGVRLNLKHTDFVQGRIQVSVRWGGGRLTAPKDEPGLIQVASGVFAAGGLGLHSVDELQRVLAGRTVAFSFGVTDDAFVFAGATNQTDLLLQFQLLAAYLTDPGYRPEAFRQFQKGIEEAYNRMAHAVEGPLQTEAPRLMANNDPRFGLPPKKVMLRRTADEVRAWLAPQLASGPIEIAVVGDLDVDATVAAVKATFGALPVRGEKPTYASERNLSFPAEALHRDYTVSTELDRGVVQLEWPATDRRDIHLARRLNLLAAVFADRLRLRLREKLGGTYSPEADADLSEAFPGYGFILAQASVDPARAREMAGAIEAVAADLTRDGVTADELERAKQPVLTSLRTSERQNDYWMSVLNAVQELPNHLEWSHDRYADYAAITAADLDALARQYLPAERASRFIIVPETKTK